MVMMQSPNSDSGHSPASSSPNSPVSNGNPIEPKFTKIETKTLSSRYQPEDDDSYTKDVKPKFNVLLSKENNSAAAVQAITRNNLDQILYPKTNDRDLLETSAKFSIERLKQLADQRLSPSNIENNSLTNNKIFSIDHSLKYSNNNNNNVSNINNNVITNTVITTASSATHLNNSDTHNLIQNQINHHIHNTNNHQHLSILNQAAFNNLKYGINNNSLNNNNGSNNSHPSELDIERIKIARTLSNGKEISDFGFRIQLGGLTANYAHSETSEELNVDGNEDSSQDGHSVSRFFCVCLEPNRKMIRNSLDTRSIWC